MTVRMDSGLKSSFDSLCSQFGMSANTAMVIFAKAVVQRGKIPFEIRGDKPVATEENDGLKAFRALRAVSRSRRARERHADKVAPLHGFLSGFLQ